MDPNQLYRPQATPSIDVDDDEDDDDDDDDDDENRLQSRLTPYS